jgi:hypothetical protein
MSFMTEEEEEEEAHLKEIGEVPEDGPGPSSELLWVLQICSQEQGGLGVIR